jgi:hypothetical protein
VLIEEAMSVFKTPLIQHIHVGQARSRALQSADLPAGDWVRVRSPGEILATLDSQGRLDGMPFMPEMLASCGKTFRVYKRAHKTCDTVATRCALRKLERTVHLEDSRCDGRAHGGCDAACLLFWNEAWLEPAEEPNHSRPAQSAAPSGPRGAGCTLEQLTACTQAGHDAEKGPRYVCQATELQGASRPMPKLDVRHYVEHYLSGNVDHPMPDSAAFARVAACR